jgi:hydroxymethylglutaryl-CoA lyase
MRLYVNDVAVRDGFQIEKTSCPPPRRSSSSTSSRARAAPHRGHVVRSPKAVPALADANEVLAGIDRVPGVVYVALVPNVRGAQNAAAARSVPTRSTAWSSARRRTTAPTSTARTSSRSRSSRPMVRVAHEAGDEDHDEPVDDVRLPFRGPRARGRGVRLRRRFRDLGFDGISLADTTGMANPRQVRDLTRAVLERFPPTQRHLLHAAFPQHARHGARQRRRRASRPGVRSFDGSVAGLGRLPVRAREPRQHLHRRTW